MNLRPKFQKLIVPLMLAGVGFTLSIPINSRPLAAAEDCAECKRIANERNGASSVADESLTKALHEAEAASFLKQCGNAPIRLFEDQLALEAEQDGEMSPIKSRHVRGDLKNSRVAQNFGHDLHPDLVDPALARGLAYQVFPELTQYARLRVLGPGAEFVYKKGDTIPLHLEGDGAPLAAYRANDLESANRQIKVWTHNEDVTLNTLARLIPLGFRLKFENLECPLPEAKQGDFCAKMEFPFDPSAVDPKVAKRFGNHAKPRGTKPGSDEQIEPKIFRKVTRRHDARGFAYAVQYENEKGERFPKKFETRYSSNPYFILSLLTESPCPGWKVRKLSLNFHHKYEGVAYAYEMDEEKNELVRGKGIFTSALTANKDKIYAAYAKGAEINFIGCNTLTGTQVTKIKDPQDGRTLTDVDAGVGIGDIFTQMTDPENPIGVVSGYNGTCYPLLPTATTPRVGRKTIWKKGTAKKKFQPPPVVPVAN